MGHLTHLTIVPSFIKQQHATESFEVCFKGKAWIRNHNLPIKILIIKRWFIILTSLESTRSKEIRLKIYGNMDDRSNSEANPTHSKHIFPNMYSSFSCYLLWYSLLMCFFSLDVSFFNYSLLLKIDSFQGLERWLSS